MTDYACGPRFYVSLINGECLIAVNAFLCFLTDHYQGLRTEANLELASHKLSLGYMKAHKLSGIATGGDSQYVLLANLNVDKYQWCPNRTAHLCR